MSIEICLMPAERIGEAVRLSQTVFGGGTDASLRACFENEANRFFVACSDGILVGFGGYSLAADQADVIDVAVLPAYRRRGIARALMHAVLADAAARGGETVFLEVRASNAPAIALYTALGFSACGIRKNYYANPREDAVLMMRPLGGSAETEGK